MKRLVISIHDLIVRFVGKLVGRYYDPKGNPTKYLKGVEAKAARGAQLLKKQEIEEAKQPSCNSRWSQDEGGEVCVVFLTIHFCAVCIHFGLLSRLINKDTNAWCVVLLFVP